MYLGMPTLIETPDIESCAKLCAELGLDFIELNMNLPQYQPDSIDIESYNKIAAKYHISYTLHLDENTDPCDFNPHISEAYLKSIKESVELAKRLDAHIINMHMPKGVYFTLPDRKVYLFEEYSEKYLDGIDLFKDICDKAVRGSDIKICIENSNGYENFQKMALRILLQSKAFGLTFDIGHNYASGGGDEEFVMSMSEKLLHFHIHDATRNRDHLSFGEGEMDIEKYLRLADKLGASAVIETKTVSSLIKSCNIIKSF